MPVKLFGISAGGAAWTRDAVYPPVVELLVSTVPGLIERCSDFQFRIRINVLQFSISGIEAGATSFTYRLKLNVIAKADVDTRNFRVDNYESFDGSIGGDDYEESALTGDAINVALSTLAVGDNSLTLSGIDPIFNGALNLRCGISGGEPTDHNHLSFSAMLEVSYHFSPAPVNLNIDGDINNGIPINRALIHRFGWATGQPGTRFILKYKRTSDVGWTTIDQTTSSQFWDAPAATFTAGADNTWQWKVQEYNGDGDLSAESVVKTFSATGALTNPAVAPSGTISTGLPNITLTAVGHTRERYRIYEALTLIYDTGELIQSSNAHQVVAQYFRNGKTALENMHSYTIKGQIIAADGSSGEGQSNITVLFTPPNKPLIVLSLGEAFIRYGYSLPVGGAAVTRVDLLVSEDYNPSTAIGTFRELVSGIVPASDITNPNYFFFEAQHGKAYYFRARSWAGTASIDGDPQPAVLLLPGWLWIHDVTDPVNTILGFQGHAYGQSSNLSREYQPKLTAGSFIGQRDASIDREVTAAGEQIGIETVKVSILSIVAAGKDLGTVRGKLEALLRSQNTVCLRTVESPMGVIKLGGVAHCTLPSSVDPMQTLYPFTFDLVVTG
jgi:hypothetical protein